MNARRGEKGGANLFHTLHCDERINRDKARLDSVWLTDDILEESENLPEPDVLAEESSKISKLRSSNSAQSVTT